MSQGRLTHLFSFQLGNKMFFYFFSSFSKKIAAISADKSKRAHEKANVNFIALFEIKAKFE